jgi:hypothetical protein
MTQQSGRGERSHNGGVADQVADKARELGGEALDRADEWLGPVGLSIKERPMTCLAVVSGLAFAAGAIWMLRNSQRQSQMQELMGSLSDLSRRSRWW